MVTTIHNVPDAAMPLVDRAEERAVLRDLCARSDAGEGHLVLIGGEAGIGKTTLALAAAARVPHGTRVLIGRSYDLMETPPYGPWRDCFRRWPEGPGIPSAPFRDQGEEPRTQEALFTQVHAALAAVARARLLILILDDIQWADPASLDLLRHLAHDLASRRILIICTYRSDELTADHPLTALLPRLGREAPTTRIILPRFMPAMVTEMVTTQFGGGQQIQALSRSVYRTTAGNPLFVREMCRALVSTRAVRQSADGSWSVVSTTLPSPPETLQELVAARIARLNPSARRILEVAAIIGQTFTFPLLRQVLAQPEEEVLEALEQAAATNMIGEDDPEHEQYHFTHPIIHEVCYHAVLVTRRRQWHRRIGEAIEATATPGDATEYDRLAYHFGQAHDGARAVGYLNRAGDAAMRIFARATASQYYEEALALLGSTASEERDHLLLKLARAMNYADPLRSQEYAETALQGFLARGDRVNIAQVRRRLASSYWRFGRYREAEEQCRLAMHALREAAGEDAAVVTGPLLLTTLRDQGKYRETVQEGQVLLAIAKEQTHTDAYYDLSFITGQASAALGSMKEAYGVMQRGLEGQSALNNPYTASSMLSLLFLTVALSSFADRMELLTDLARQHSELAERGRAQVGVPVPAGWFLPAYWAFLQGDWQRARQDLLALPDPQPTSILARVEWALCAAQFAHAEGRTADGIAIIRRQLPPPGADWTLPHHLHIRLMNLLGHLSLANRQFVAAKQALDEGAALLARSVYVPAVAEHHLAWATFYHMRGQPQRAQTSATTAAEEATAHHDLMTLAAARRMLGELAMERGAWQSADSEFAKAEEIALRIPAAHERAALALTLATLQITRTDTRDRAVAQQALTAAAEIVVPLGAAPLLTRLDLLRTQWHAVNPAQAYGITAREADVLRHLVAGASNQEIADHLSISRRTVDQHVSNILGKLGVTNRVAATSLALERGLVDEAGSRR